VFALVFVVFFRIFGFPKDYNRCVLAVVCGEHLSKNPKTTSSAFSTVENVLSSFF